MIAIDSVTGGGRRILGRALSGVRQAPYLRKWLALGMLIGGVAGLGAIVFYYGLTWGTQLLLTDLGGYRPPGVAGEGGYQPGSGFSRPWAIPLVVGAGGLISGLLVFTWAPEAEGHGTDSAIKAVHANPKGVRPRVIVVKLVASIITIASGGSGGREGPTAQISSGFGSTLARALNLTPRDARICVAAGIAAGIGAIFKAPLGGAMLGAELLYVEDVEIEALLPSIVATSVGYGIFCSATGGFTPVFGNNPDAGVGNPWELALFAVVGVAAGLVGRLYTWSFYGLTDWWNRVPMPRVVKPAVAGVVVGLIGLEVPGALGTGYGALQGELDLHVLVDMPLLIVLVLPLAKILTTSMSIGSGGSGGIFGPGLVIGGATGALLWRLGHQVGIGTDVQLAFVIVGMAACFGAIAHAQVSVLLMVAEMTGTIGVLPPAMVALAFSSLVVGSTSIYRSQLMHRSDSPAHRFGFGMATDKAVGVAEVMRAPRLVLPDGTRVADAVVHLSGSGLPGAPVVNNDGAFLGVVQLADLSDLPAARRAESLTGHLDAEAMTLPTDAGLDAALEALPASEHGWVPVLDNDFRPVGIVSAVELVQGWERTMRASVRAVSAATRDAQLVDVEVGTTAPAVRRAVRDLGLPRSVVIVSITRGHAVVLPQADEVLRAGDRLAVLTPASALTRVQRIFG